MRFRLSIERGRPFIGVAAAKQSIASLLDPANTAQLEQKILAAKTVAVSKTSGARAIADAEEVDIDKLTLRLSCSSESAGGGDPSDCMAILNNFQVRGCCVGAMRGDSAT